MHTTQGLLVSSQAPLTGEINITTSAVQLPNVPNQYGTIKAAAGNTGVVYIGGPSVTVASGTTNTTAGYQLAAGDEMTIPVNNLNVFYAIGSSAGDDISYICYN